MGKLTDYGRRVQATALAKELSGGTYRTYDGDGALLGKAEFAGAFAIHEDGCGFTFKEPAKGKVSKRGIARRFEACGVDGAALIEGTVGGPMNKGVDASMADPQLYEGMDLEVQEFSHRLNFGPQT